MLTTKTKTALEILDMPLKDLLPPQLAEALIEMGVEQKRTIHPILLAALEKYIIEWQEATHGIDPDFEEDSDEEIIAGFKQGWRDAMTGNVVSWEEMMKDFDEDDDEN